MVVEVGCRWQNLTFKRSVELARGSPVVGDSIHVLAGQPRVTIRESQHLNNVIEVWLAGSARKWSHRGVSDIQISFGRFQNRSCLNTSGVVRVEVNRNAHFFLQSLNQRVRGGRFAEAGHVFDGQNVGSHVLKFFGQANVVLEVVLSAVRVRDVAAVTDGRFANRAAFNDRVHRDLHIGRPVKRVEHAEHVDAAGGRFFHEFTDNVVRVVGIADRIGCSQQHLKQNIRNAFAHLFEPLPGALFKKPHRHIECRSTPHFDGEHAGTHPRVGVGDVQQIRRSHACGQQRLMSVTERGVRQHELFLIQQPLRKPFGTEFLELLPCSVRDW